MKPDRISSSECVVDTVHLPSEIWNLAVRRNPVQGCETVNRVALPLEQSPEHTKAVNSSLLGDVHLILPIGYTIRIGILNHEMSEDCCCCCAASRNSHSDKKRCQHAELQE